VSDFFTIIADGSSGVVKVADAINFDRWCSVSGEADQRVAVGFIDSVLGYVTPYRGSTSFVLPAGEELYVATAEGYHAYVLVGGSP
jgi:hypothetical protein